MQADEVEWIFMKPEDVESTATADATQADAQADAQADEQARLQADEQARLQADAQADEQARLQADAQADEQARLHLKNDAPVETVVSTDWELVDNENTQFTQVIQWILHLSKLQLLAICAGPLVSYGGYYIVILCYYYPCWACNVFALVLSVMFFSIITFYEETLSYIRRLTMPVMSLVSQLSHLSPTKRKS